MDNDLDLYNIQLVGDIGSWGVSVRDLENEFRNIADIVRELADTVSSENIMLSLGGDIEPIYPVSKFKTELNGEWNEDDGQKISEFLNQFKIIE